MWRFLCVVMILQTDQSAAFIVFPTSFFWSFSPPIFFNVAFVPHATNSCINHHNLVFIASTLKVRPRIALVFLYTTIPFKASKSSFKPLDAPGYVSGSTLSLTTCQTESFVNDFYLSSSSPIYTVVSVLVTTVVD